MAGFNFFGGGRGNQGGGASGQGQQQGGGDGGEGDDAILPNGEQGDDSGGELDPAKILSGFFGGDESGDGGDDGGDGGDGGGEQPRGQNGQGQNQNNGGGNGNGNEDPDNKLAVDVATEVNNLLKGITAPDDLLPENFDPNDPQQMRQVMTRAMQHSALNAMQITFKPMQVAMRQLAVDLQNQIRQELQGFGSKQSARQVFTRLVPEAETEEYGAMANGLFDQAMKKKGATAESAAKMVRAALDQFGIAKGRSGNGGGSNGGGGNGDPFIGGFKTGDAALDTFAPLPKPRNQQRR